MWAKILPSPFLSIIIDDCIKNGRDYNDGGARYNSSYIQGDCAFLEEDVDLATFLEAMKKAGQSVTIKEYHSNKDSKIRKYDSFNTWRDKFDEDFHYNVALDELDFIELSDDGKFYEVNLKGGTISANIFLMREKDDAVGTMDVGGGMLTIDGDETSLVQGYIDNGWITFYDGDGTPHFDYDVTNPGLTTLTAVHMLNPDPANRVIVTPGAVELSWTLPDPCVPGQPVSVDVYFADDYDALWNFTDPEAIKVVSNQNATSVVLQTQTKTRYFWAVDTYIGSDNDPILGPIFSFLADNAPPSVNASPDISTFLQDGIRTGPLSGIVTDDGVIQPYTVTWSVVEQPSDADSALPGAVIADPTALQTTVTVSAEGTYVLQLEANDGEYTSSDTMTINVHPDDWTNRASGL